MPKEKKLTRFCKQSLELVFKSNDWRYAPAQFANAVWIDNIRSDTNLRDKIIRRMIGALHTGANHEARCYVVKNGFEKTTGYYRIKGAGVVCVDLFMTRKQPIANFSIPGRNYSHKVKQFSLGEAVANGMKQLSKTEDVLRDM